MCAALNAIAATAGPMCKEAVGGALGIRLAENGRQSIKDEDIPEEAQTAIISNFNWRSCTIAR